MKVKNLTGTGQRSCTCGSWLAHWENGAGRNAKYCSNALCWSDATVGGHVVKVGGTDNAHYIVPLCDSCNKLSDEYEVGDSVAFVSANKQKTCAAS